MIRRPQSAPLFPYTTLFRSQWLSGYATDNLHIAGSSMGGAIASVMAHTLDRPPRTVTRSEEHTSELQSRPHLVCRLLLEKKKNIAQSNLETYVLFSELHHDS